jgi:hypothetical protein
MYQGSIRRLQVDLIAACNARCPLCNRQDDQGHRHRFFPLNRQLPLPIFRKALADPALSGVEEIFFNGVFGDTLASPDLLRFLDAIEDTRGPLRWNIHTNGSLGSVELWRELGRRSRKSGRLVKFSIDGLADTNGFYRRGVSWEAVMANARAFIAAGGRAVWKYVVFEHNRHQTAEAERLAAEMGFLRFEPRRNYMPNSEPLRVPGPVPSPDVVVHAPDFYDVPAALAAATEIRCRALADSTVYLDFDGRIWPCCWIPGWKYTFDRGKREWHEREVEARLAGRNSLAEHSVGEILSQPWFREHLPASLKSRSVDPAPHKACMQNCGTREW